MIMSIALLGVVAILLLNSLQEAHDFEKRVRIDRNGVVTEKLEVNDLTLNPGSKTEYTVKLKCKLEGTYDLSLVFVETEQSPLKDFVNVTVEHKGEVLKTATLAELLSGTSIDLVCDLNSVEYTDLIVRFEMPLDVGNEAKGATADFDIDMTIAIQA